ncbi:hypothetical protein L596_015648 [Steinernema carpocapsae]|uniref:Uncharacterized protein n=1 Tax=Steinernema carpocapsae TaxID=34508 RepID=A0A4U5NFM4_STECR|nr:hypothetical protein L596_015648 [Steinernema carpocapsae]
MISNATAIMIDQSSLKQLQGYVTFDRIQNIVENLKYYFKLTITVPSRNPINAIDVRRIIFSSISAFQNALNGVVVDPISIQVYLL